MDIRVRNIKNSNNPNIVKSICLLLEELTFHDIITVKEQVDSKLFKMGNDNRMKYNPNEYVSDDEYYQN